MEYLQNYPEILQADESKRIVRNYNKVAKVLLEFEVLYHQAWVKQVWFTPAAMRSENIRKESMVENIIDKIREGR